MPDDQAAKPFDTGYVMRTTAKHCRRDIDISIRKTYDRVQDFPADSPQSREVFKALGALHAFRKMLDDFQRINQIYFKSE